MPGVLMKLGAFGIIRLGIQILPEGAEFWMPALLVLGTIGALYGAIAALTQRDFKLISGYSSVSHMGYVLIGLATLHEVGVSGAALQMFSHGVMTALVFLLIGALYDQAHTRDLSDFGGVAKVMPLWVIAYVMAGLANVGLPGLSGFTARSSTSSWAPSRRIRCLAGSPSWRRRSRRPTCCACSASSSSDRSTRAGAI